jgi:arginine exporter protein ArgO
MVVMKDPVNIKSSVEHMAFAKGAMRSQISQLSTRKKKEKKEKGKSRRSSGGRITSLILSACCVTWANPTLHSSSFDRGTSSNPHPEIKNT